MASDDGVCYLWVPSDIDSDNDARVGSRLFNPLLPVTKAVQALYRYLQSCQARSSHHNAEKSDRRVSVSIKGDGAANSDAVASTTASIPNIIFLVQNKWSGKSTTLVQLAKYQMLGCIVDIDDFMTRYDGGWHSFCRPEYSDPSEPSAHDKIMCACFISCQLAAASIQLARLVRTQLQQLGWAHGNPSKTLSLEEWRVRVVGPIAETIHSSTETRKQWHNQISHQTIALMTEGMPLTQDELVQAIAEASEKKHRPFNSIEYGKIPTIEDADFDPIAYYARELDIYFSDQHVDSLFSLFADVLGPEQAKAHPLFFFAIEGPERLLEHTKDTLVEFWHLVKQPSSWLILADRGFPQKDRFSSCAQKCADMALTTNALITHDAFVDVAMDTAWDVLVPSSSAETRTFEQLQGLTFAALECVSLRYGRPIWLIKDFTGLPGVHFGPVSLLRVLREVLDQDVRGKVPTSTRIQNFTTMHILLSLRAVYDSDGWLSWVGDVSRRSACLSSRRIVSYRPLADTDATTSSRKHIEVQTGAPGEPVCSALAAYLFRTQLKTFWASAITVYACTASLYDVQTPECTGSLLLLMASDAAHHDRSFGPWGCLSPQPDTYEDLLERDRINGLLEPIPLWNMVENFLCKPQEPDAARSVAGPEARTKRLLQTRLINFTHFATMPSIWAPGEAIPLAVLVDGWIRQCAWVGQQGQEGWNLLIPVHPLDEDYVDRSSQGPASLAFHSFKPDLLEFVLVRVLWSSGEDEKEGPVAKGRAAGEMGEMEVEQAEPEGDGQETATGSTLANVDAGDKSVALLTWSRVGDISGRSDAASGGSHAEVRSHLFITMDLDSQGETRWLSSDLASGASVEGMTEQERTSDTEGEQGDVSSRRVHRADLWLYGKGKDGIYGEGCPLARWIGPLGKKCSFQ